MNFLKSPPICSNDATVKQEKLSFIFIDSFFGNEGLK